MVLGLSRLLPPEQLTVIVNTADDEEFYGLHVSPDLDTVMYTLAGMVNTDTGWGVQGDTLNSLNMLSKYGHDTWFTLGDKDLASHIYRTDLLKSGHSLSEATRALSSRLGVTHSIIPMTDDPVRTMVETEIGCLRFQEYFVKFKCEPKVNSIAFKGAENAVPAQAFANALTQPAALIFGPSNPYLSIAPILAVPGVRDKIRDFNGPRMAVSPIVGDRALRGPAAKMMGELGFEVSCVSVAKDYAGLCDIFVIDEVDRMHAHEIESLGFQVEILNTVMISEQDKIDLSRRLLAIIAQK